jgi:hypothetical protein
MKSLVGEVPRKHLLPHDHLILISSLLIINYAFHALFIIINYSLFIIH